MNNQVRKIIFASVIAAIYAALTFMLWPISFYEFQFRFAEVLAILPYFFPVAVPGLYVGCIIANLASPYFLGDLVIGSTATLIAALITMRIGKSSNNEQVMNKALACLPPVIINAVFIGAMIASFMTEDQQAAFWPAFTVNALQIGFGQAVVLYLVGLPLMIYLPRMGAIDRLNQIYKKNTEQQDYINK